MVSYWSDLPADLLQSIANVLNLIDYVRFRAVCVVWRSSTVHPHNLLNPSLPGKLPWALRLLDKQRITFIDFRTDMVSFVFLSDCKRFDMSLPGVRGDRIVDCTDGWLSLLDCQIPALRLVLVNPLTRAQIHLPPLVSLTQTDKIKYDIVTAECFGRVLTRTRTLGWLRHNLVQKVLFSEDHTVIMVYLDFFNILAFVNYNDEEEKWTVIDLPSRRFSDILHHKGSFYVVDCRGRLAICNLSSPASSLTPVASAQVDVKYLYDWSLASYGEELLLIATNRFSYTFQPRVFRFDSKSRSILELKSLGDRILFLGTNCTLSLSATDCPPGFKPDSIYVTMNSNYRSTYGEFGFYSLEDRCFYPKSLEPERERRFRPSMWLTPRLC